MSLEEKRQWNVIDLINIVSRTVVHPRVSFRTFPAVYVYDFFPFRPCHSIFSRTNGTLESTNIRARFSSCNNFHFSLIQCSAVKMSKCFSEKLS